MVLKKRLKSCFTLLSQKPLPIRGHSYEMLDLNVYDRVIVAFSGGKDWLHAYFTFLSVAFNAQRLNCTITL